MTPAGELRLVRVLARAATRDGWTHEDDAEEAMGRVRLDALCRRGLIERTHTRPARPGDQGFTVWYRPKETP